MSPLRIDFPIRKKGYKSPEEVEKREREIIALFKDEKTFAELLRLAKKKGWSKSSLWRYLERMVKERKLIKEGKRRGAVYRCNLVELMELDHFAYLDKIREFCSQEGLYSFHEMGAVNCSILGIPSEGLTDYERLVARAIVEKLSSTWLLLFGLRGIFSQRLQTEKEVIGFYTMLSLYKHEFNEILNNILEHARMSNPKMIKDFFKYLKKSVISWTEENKMHFPPHFWSLYNLIEQYDLEKADRGIYYPPLEFEGKNVELYPEELVALTITGNMMESKDFIQRIENWLNYYLLNFFEDARQFNFNKAQEITEVALEIFKTVSPRRWNLQSRAGPVPPVLGKEEKERLLNWNLLLDRYGEENTKFILDLVEGATSRFAEKMDEFDVQKWIMENTHSYLKKRGIIELYVKEKFWS